MLFLCRQSRRQRCWRRCWRCDANDNADVMSTSSVLSKNGDGNERLFALSRFSELFGRRIKALSSRKMSRNFRRRWNNFHVLLVFCRSMNLKQVASLPEFQFQGKLNVAWSSWLPTKTYSVNRRKASETWIQSWRDFWHKTIFAAFGDFRWAIVASTRSLSTFLAK